MDHQSRSSDGFSGIPTTAGHLLFTGDVSGNVFAADPANGEILDGRQFLLSLWGNVVYAWNLPEEETEQELQNL